VTEAERDGVAFVFNTPNEKSRPGYLKMGWSDVARWPVWIRVRRPHKLALAASRRRLAGGPAVEPPPGSGLLPAGDALSDPAAAELCEQDAATLSGIATNRSLRFLRWRYAEGPISYHVMKLEGPRRNGVAANITEVVGLVVVRLRLRGDLREVVICDVLARADGRGAIGAALRAVAAKADADHAVAHFGSAWPWSEVLSASGFRRLPRSGVRFTVRPLPASPSRALVLDAGSWALAPGDLELF
jgi:hypothetical protein